MIKFALPCVISYIFLLGLVSGLKPYVPNPVLHSRSVNSQIIYHPEDADNANRVRFINEEAMVAQSKFPVKPDYLVELAKDALRKQVGLDDESVLADDFQFCAPVVGPLTKEQYLGALRNFKITDAFPDLDANYHFVRVDPFEHNRVWWFTRSIATHSGPLLGKEPTGTVLELPPQANSFVFNEEGKIKEMTIGYVLDRRVGNTGGLGGIFGFLYGVGQGLPIPECKPYKPSLRFRLFNFIGSVASRFRKKKDA